MVRWCLSLGANPHASSPLGETIMQRAASYGSIEVLKLLTEHGCLVGERDLVARAALHRGSDEPECLEVARFLLDHGLPIDAYFAEGTAEENNPCSCELAFVGRQNALHLAIGFGKTGLVKLLVERGADKSLPTWSAMKTKGKTVSPVELARMCGHEDIVALLEGQETSVGAS